MKITNEKFEVIGDLVKSNDTYQIIDNTDLERLSISSTDLRPGKTTRGHSHDAQEEVYTFTLGRGKMKVGETVFGVEQGDIVVIPGGAFHKVFNDGPGVLRFVCIFEGKRILQ